MRRLLLIGLVAVLFMGAGPVEPPTPIRVPREQLRSAFPDMPLQEFEWMVQAWRDYTNDLVASRDYIYEALRGVSATVQYGELYLPLNDTANLVFETAFSDTLYGVAFVRLIEWHDTAGTWTGTSKIKVGRVWPDSCHVVAGTDNQGYVKYIAAGQR